MRSALVILVIAAAVAFVIAAQAVPKTSKADIAQGNYIVNRVSMCVDCHTPKTKDGKLDEKRKLAGSPMGPNPKVANWASKAPNLTPAGFLKGWSDAALVKFMMTGITPEGDRPHPPMPPYRLNQKDAKAVTAYLRSIPAIK